MRSQAGGAFCALVSPLHRDGAAAHDGERLGQSPGAAARLPGADGLAASALSPPRGGLPSAQRLSRAERAQDGGVETPPGRPRARPQDRTFMAGRRRPYGQRAALVDARAAAAAAARGGRALRQPAIHRGRRRNPRSRRAPWHHRAPLAGGNRRLRRDRGARVRARPRRDGLHGARSPHRSSGPAGDRHGAVRLRLALRRAGRAHAVVSLGTAPAPARDRRLVAGDRIGPRPAQGMSAGPEYAFVTAAPFAKVGEVRTSPSAVARSRTLAPVSALIELGYDARAYSLCAENELATSFHSSKVIVLGDSLAGEEGGQWPYSELLGCVAAEKVLLDFVAAPEPGTARFDAYASAFPRAAGLTAASRYVAARLRALAMRPVDVVADPYAGTAWEPRAARPRRRSRALEWLAARAGPASMRWCRSCTKTIRTRCGCRSKRSRRSR